jgi:hypothetical protein
MEKNKQDSGEFDTEGDIFQEKGTRNTPGHQSDNDFDTGLVMRDSFGREVRQSTKVKENIVNFIFQIGRRDSLESSWLPGDSSPLVASANTSPFSTMSKIQLSALSSASSR